MANIIKTKALVLNTMPFKESSLIASLLTEKSGKIKVLAKGVRRPKSKLCGTLELFSLDEIIFYKRELKEIYTLSDAVIIDNFEEIRSHPEKVNAAVVLCEFFDKTLPLEERDDDSFFLLSHFLKKLQATNESVVKSLALCYLLKALSGAGVRPHMANCVRCHEPITYDNKKIDFSISAGGIVCNKDFDDTVIFLSSNTINTLRQIYNNKDIHVDENSLNEIESFIPDYLYYHLNNLILNSLKYLK